MCFLWFLPRRQSLFLWEQRRRPPPAAETGRSCWGRGQQDASDSEADAGCRNPGSGCEADGEGRPGMKEALHSDKQSLCKSDAIAAFVPFVSALALSGAARQLSQGESLISCISQSPKAPTRQRRMGAFDYRYLKRKRMAFRYSSVRFFLSRLRMTAPTTLPMARATQYITAWSTTGKTKIPP